MFEPRNRQLGRPRGHYATLKQEAAMIAERAARDRYATTPTVQLAIQVPKPLLLEATATRRELAARQRRPIAPPPSLAPSYRRRRHYAMALQPV